MSTVLELLRAPWEKHHLTLVEYKNRKAYSVDQYYLRERMINVTGAQVDFRIKSTETTTNHEQTKSFLVMGELHILGMKSSDEIGAFDIGFDDDNKNEDAYKAAVTNCFVRCCKSFGIDVEPVVNEGQKPKGNSSVTSPTKSVNAALKIATSEENQQKEEEPLVEEPLVEEPINEESVEREPDFTLSPKEQDVFTDLIDRYGKSVFEGWGKGYSAQQAYLIQEKLSKEEYAVLCKKFHVDLEKYREDKGYDRLSAKRCYEHYCISNGVTLKKSQAEIELYLQRVEEKSEAMKDLAVGTHEEDVQDAKAAADSSSKDDEEEKEPAKTITDEVEETLPRTDPEVVDLWDEVEDETGKNTDDFAASLVISRYEQMGTFGETFKNFLRVAPRADIDAFIKEFA